MYQMIMKRVYRENVAMLHKYRQKAFKDRSKSIANDVTRYEESMDILGMKPDDMIGFLNSDGKFFWGNLCVDDPSRMENDMMRHFEAELGNRDNLDVNLVYKLISEIIEERLARERGDNAVR